MKTLVYIILCTAGIYKYKGNAASYTIGILEGIEHLPPVMITLLRNNLGKQFFKYIYTEYAKRMLKSFWE